MATANQLEKKTTTTKNKRPYRQIVSSLEQVIWVEDPLIMCPQVRANSLAWSKAHLHRYLSPTTLPADCIKATFFIYQLGKKEIMHLVCMCRHNFYPYANKHFLVNIQNCHLYRVLITKTTF